MKNRSSIVSSILSNGDMLEKVKNTSLTSAGSALKENATYLDSISGKIQTLQVNFQTLWANAVNNDVLKFFINLGSEILKLVDNIGLFNSAIGGLAIVKSFQHEGFFDFTSKNGSKLFSNWGKDFVSALDNGVKSVKKNLSSWWKSSTKASDVKNSLSTLLFGDKQFRTAIQQQIPEIFSQDTAKDLISRYQANASLYSPTEFANTLTGLSEASKNAFVNYVSGADAATLSAEGLIGKSQEMATAAQASATSIKAVGIAGKAASIGMSLLSAGLNTILSMGLAMGFSALVDFIDEASHAEENAIEKAKEAQNVINELNEGIKKSQSTVDDNKDRYITLLAGVNIEDKSNMSLTTDEYQEFLDINKELADTFPLLERRYDSQGNALVNLGSSADDVTQSLSDLLEQEKALAQYKISQNLSDVFEGFKPSIKNHLKNIQEAQGTLNNLPSGELGSYSVTGVDNFDINDLSTLDGKEVSQVALKLFQAKDATDGQIKYNKLQAQALQEAAKELGLQVIDTGLRNRTDASGNLLGYDSSYFVDVTKDNAKDFFGLIQENLKNIGLDNETIAEEQQSRINEEMQELTSEWNTIVPTLISSISANASYSKLDPTIQAAINTAISNLDPVKEWYDEATNTWNWPEDEAGWLAQKYVNPIKNQPKARQQRFSDYLKVYNDENATIDQKAKAMQRFVGTFAGDEGIKILEDYGVFNKASDYRSGNVLNADDLAKYNFLKDKGYSSSDLDTWTTKDLEVAYDIVANDNFSGTFDQLDYRIKQATEETSTLKDWLSDETNDTTIDNFQSKTSKLLEGLSKFKKGSLIGDDLLDFLQEFPEFANDLDHLESSINDSNAKNLTDTIGKIFEGAEDLSPKGQEQAKQYAKNIIDDTKIYDVSKAKLKNTMADRGIYGTAINDIFDEYSSELSTAEGRSIMFKMMLDLDTDPASLSAEEFRKKYDDTKLTYELTMKEDTLTNLQNELSQLQDSAEAEEGAIALEEAQGKTVDTSHYRNLSGIYGDEVENGQATKAFHEKEREDLLKKNPNADTSEVDNNIHEADMAINSAMQKQADYDTKVNESEYEEIDKNITALANKANAMQEQIQVNEAEGIKATKLQYQYLKANSVETVKEYQKKGEILQKQKDDLVDKWGKKADTTSIDDLIEENNSKINSEKINQANYNDKIRDIKTQDINDDLTKLQNEANKISEEISLNEKMGIKATADQYESLISYGDKQIADYEKLNKFWNEEKQHLVDIGADYSDVDKEIAQNESSINSIKQSQIDWNEAIRQIDLSKLQNELSQLQDSASKVSDEMSLDSTRGIKATVSQYQELLSNSQQQIQNLQLQNEQLQAYKEMLQSIGADYTEVDSLIRQNESSINSAYQSQIEWNKAAKELQFNPEEGLTAYNTASSTRNAGDNYLDMLAAAKSAQEAREKGLIGTDEFQAAAKMFSPAGADDVTNWDENYGKITRYFTEDSTGLLNFLNDLKSKTNDEGEALASLNETTGEWTYNIDDVRASANKLGISFEAFLAIMGRLQDYGFSNDFFSTTEEGEQHLASLYTDLAEAQQTLQDMETGANNEGIKASESALAAQEEKVNSIRQSIKETEDLLDQLAQKTAQEYSSEYYSGGKAITTALATAAKQNNKDVQQYMLKEIQALAVEKGFEKEFNQAVQVDANGTYSIDETQLNELTQKMSEGYETNLELDTTHAEKAMDELSQKIKKDKSEDVQGYLDALSEYSSADLEGITLGNGAYDKAGFEAAEDALQGLATSLDLTDDEANLLISTLEKMGVLKVAPEVDTTQSEEAIDNLSTKIGDSLENNTDPVIQDALSTLAAYTESDLSGIILGNGAYETGTRVAEEALDSIVSQLGLSTDEANVLVATLSKLGLLKPEIEPEVDEDKVDEAMGDAQKEVDKDPLKADTEVDVSLDQAYSGIQRAQDLLSSVDGDTATTEVDVQTNASELDSIVKELEGLGQEKLIQIGFTPSSEGAPITAEDIKEQIGSIQIPVEYVSKNAAGDDTTVDEKVIPVKTGAVDKTTVDKYQPETKTVPVKTGILDRTSLMGITLPPLIQEVQVRRTTVTNDSPSKSGGNASGTLIAHADGTAYNMLNLKAHASGTDVSLKQDENALVNELGKIMLSINLSNCWEVLRDLQTTA